MFFSSMIQNKKRRAFNIRLSHVNHNSKRYKYSWKYSVHQDWALKGFTTTHCVLHKSTLNTTLYTIHFASVCICAFVYKLLHSLKLLHSNCRHLCAWKRSFRKYSTSIKSVWRDVLGSQKMVLWWDTRQGSNESHSISMQITYATESAGGSEIHVKTAVMTGVTPLKTPLYCNTSEQRHNFVPFWETDPEFEKDTCTRQELEFCLPHIMWFSLVIGVWESKAPKMSSDGLRNFKKYYGALF